VEESIDKSDYIDEIATTVPKNGSINIDNNQKYEINNETMNTGQDDDNNHFPRIKGELGNLILKYKYLI